MGRKGGRKNGNNVAQRHVSWTLREELSGKKQGHVSAQTMCKVDHLKSLAVWAATKASVPPLGAFFGERLAATTEAWEIRSDPSFFVCERCESILQPGSNCTIRIEKNKSKTRRRRKKSNLTTQNNIVYMCHFCSHRNLMRGTPKGYMKDMCRQKTIQQPHSQPAISSVEKHATSMIPSAVIPTISVPSTVTMPAADGYNLEASNATPPLSTASMSLLDSKRKKRTRSSAKKEPEPRTISTKIDAEKSVASSKRRKKAWTSLKEVAQSNDHDTSQKKLTNLAIPFFL